MRHVAIRPLSAPLLASLLCVSMAHAGTGDWVINEVLADPDGASGDANGNGIVNTSEDEFVEIVNLSGEDQDISGWTISDAVGVRHVFPEGTLVAADCAVVVFGAGPIGLSFVGATLQTASSGMLGFNNGGDTITLADISNVPLATMSYGAEGGGNQSLVRAPDLEGEFLLHLDVAGTQFSPGTRSDGARFEGCPDEPPPPEDTGWTINEVHADPDPALGDANGDGVVDSSADEFVEIANTSGEDRDISGWSLSDATGVRHIFLPGTIVPDDCAIVVFGGGPVGLEFNGATLQVASSGALGLNNSGDTVTLANDQGVPQATITFGGEGGENHSLTRFPDLEGELVPHVLVEGAEGTLFSPGTLATGETFLGCPDEPIDPPSVEIWEIQGAGSRSFREGEVLLTVDNVVTGVVGNGFFIQTPEERSDGDEATSDGIFVFTSRRPDVEVGDVVDVAGEIDEFFDLTEIVRATVIPKASGAELPEPVLLDASTPSPDQPVPENDLERLEGMRVELVDGVVTGPYNRFGELLVVARPERAFREPGIRFPGEPGLPVWDGNPEILEIDPDYAGLPDAILPAGAAILRCVGPLSFRFGAYQIQPTELEVAGEPTARPVRARSPGELSIGTQNLFGLFDSVDAPGLDDEVLDPFELGARLAKLAAAITGVLDSPDILAVQEVENVEVLGALATRIVESAPDVGYTAFVEPGSDPSGRNLGLLVRDTVVVELVEQIGADARFEFDGRENVTFTRPPLSLEAVWTGGDEDFAVTVIVVHLRSLIDVETEAFVRQKRLAQALWLAEHVQSIQDEDPERRLVVTGDFNAFEFTDGFVDVMGILTGTTTPGSALLDAESPVDPPLRNRLLDLAAGERYSTINEGTAQAVDHLLTSEPLDLFVTEIAFARHSADMPVGLSADASTPLRASDHDGLVIFLDPSIHGDGPFFVRGDFDSDGSLSVTDAIALLNYLFLGAAPSTCEESGDANEDGNVDLSDGVAVLGFLFLGQPAPPPPFPECGLDPTPSRDCEGSAACI